MESKKIMIVGVGGQGTLLASKLLGQMFLSKGLDVKVSEVHGMSQRGGSVVTYVSCGEKVYSPVIDKGEADFIVSFELLEAARNLEFLKEGGVLLTNTQKISPMPVITGAAAYPENIAEKIAAAGVKIDAFDALLPAKASGSARSVNLVMLGRLSKYLDFSEEEWMQAMDEKIPERIRESCKKAFCLGRG